jgi:large subunit ribosomal protein L25
MLVCSKYRKENFIMVEQKELAIALRTTMGKANKHLRKKGLIPGNITGRDQEPLAVQVELVAFDALRRSGGATSLIRLIMSDAPAQTVLIRHVQRGPISDKILHIDFSSVGVNDRITTKMPLHYVGESLSVKNKGGVLLHLLEKLDVECPASEIADYLEVDISPLTEIDAALRASDVTLPAGYTLITPKDEFIAKVAATRAEVTQAVADPAPVAIKAE